MACSLALAPSLPPCDGSPEDSLLFSIFYCCYSTATLLLLCGSMANNIDMGNLIQHTDDLQLCVEKGALVFSDKCTVALIAVLEGLSL